MIGAGIWGTTGGFAFKLESDTTVLLVWFFCGLLALTGALSLGELGGMMNPVDEVEICCFDARGPEADAPGSQKNRLPVVGQAVIMGLARPIATCTGSGRMSLLEELAHLDAIAQAELVRRGQVTPLELTDAAIARVEALNPVLNAVITPMFESARLAARGPLPPDGRGFGFSPGFRARPR